MPAAELCESDQFRAVAEIVRTGHIDGRGCVFPVGEHRFELPAFDSRPQQFAPGSQPRHIKIQQRDCLQKNPVGVSSGGDPRSAALQRCMHRREIEHRPDAERGPFRGIHRPGASEEPRCVLFALPDTAPGVIEHVRALDFRDIQRQNSLPFGNLRAGLSLVPRHMESDGVLPGIRPDKVTDRGVHAPCCSRSALAAASIIAHSMRLRNSSQPSS